MSLQFLIRVVYEHLFKAVLVEILKPVDIQHANESSHGGGCVGGTNRGEYLLRIVQLIISRCECGVHSIHEPNKQARVDKLGEGVALVRSLADILWLVDGLASNA